MATIRAELAIGRGGSIPQGKIWAMDGAVMIGQNVVRQPLPQR